ncbi:MAG TPA: hypothetical protein VNP04_13660 [Alphaproteobacteria bacterium]|nr:hypothetical protein [Alphaproteobacteria bacterium]
MGASALIVLDFPMSAGPSSIMSRLRVTVSSVSHFLDTLRSFMVSTLSWTLIDTGMSGLAENFVVRSSGVSGDRQIVLKFGASTANQTGSSLSCFACVSFASATDTASNPTTDRSISMNGANNIAVCMVGDMDHIIIVNDKIAAAVSSVFLYAGLINEFYSSVGATPNQVVVVNGNDIDGTTDSGRMVESPTGTFNVTLARLRSYIGTNTLNPVHGGGPDMNSGRVFGWPLAVVNDGSDRFYGFLKNVFMTPSRLSALQAFTTSNEEYLAVAIVNNIGTPRGSLLVRTR